MAIHLAGAVAELLCQSDTTIEILGPHARSQSVRRKIRQLQSFFRGTDGANGGKGVENFLRITVDARRGAIQGGLDVKSVFALNFRRSSGQDRLTASRGCLLLSLQD